MADQDDGSLIVARLLTTVDLDEERFEPHELSVSARLEAVLTDGRRVLLLDDRGWSSWGPPYHWTRIPVTEIAATARDVVGPDEAAPGRTQEQASTEHWERLAGDLQRSGIAVTGAELGRLRHDVVLSDPLLAHLSP